jgi:hypothetical protein
MRNRRRETEENGKRKESATSKQLGNTKVRQEFRKVAREDAEYGI